MGIFAYSLPYQRYSDNTKSIDYSNPIAYGLQFALSNPYLAGLSFVSNSRASVGTYGYQLETISNSDGKIILPSVLTFKTLLFFADIDLTNNKTYLIDSVNDRTIQLSETGNWLIWDGYSQKNFASSPQSGFHCYAFVFDGNTATYYLDGSLIEQLAFTSTMSFNAIGRNTPVGYSAISKTAQILVFDSLKSSVEIAKLSDNPWQIFEPERKFFYINSELMLTLQGLTQSQNLDTTQLTQQNILSTLGISQSQNLGTADLTQQNTLLPAEILQTQNLGGIALTQQNIVSPIGVFQAQTLGAAELTQQNILSPTGLFQAQTLDAFDLTVAGGSAPAIVVFSRPNTAQGVLEGPIIPKLNPAFSDMELCLLGGRKEGVGGSIRDFNFYGDCGFQTGGLGDGQGPLDATEGAITFSTSEKLRAGTVSGVAVVSIYSPLALSTIFTSQFDIDNDYLLAGLVVYCGSSGQVRLGRYQDGYIVSTPAASVLASKVNVVAWSYNRLTGFAQLYVNGRYASATSIRDTSTALPTGAIGGYQQENLSGVSRKIFHLCAVWGRDMTPAEVMSLGEDPWQIFQPERKTFFLPQAASELLLAPQGLFNTQQLDQTALIQQASLSVNGADQAQVLGAPSLTQQNTISPSALTQAQILGVISLVSQNTLAINGLAQSQTIGTIALTQQGALAITNMAQGQTLDGISLAQQNLLSVAGANSVQNLSSPTLASGAFLSVASAQQAQALGTLSLVQQNVLAVNGVASSQSLGNISLQQANILSVQGQVQSQSLGVLDLVFQAYLAPNSVTSSQIIDNLSLVQANILQVYGLSQDQLLESISLSQDSWLIVDDVLHQQIATNIHLLNGAATLRVAGSIVYVLGSKAPIFVLNSSAKILVTAG